MEMIPQILSFGLFHLLAKYGWPFSGYTPGSNPPVSIEKNDTCSD